MYCTEIFADEGCSVLNEATGIFATCHNHIPTDHFHTVRLLHINKILKFSIKFQHWLIHFMKLIITFRLASKELVTVATTCISVYVLLWAATPKPAPVWVLQLATGGK